MKQIIWRTHAPINQRNNVIYVKKTNHAEKDCYFRDKNKKTDQNAVAFLVGNSIKTETWVVDSGTTAHMSNNHQYIRNMQKQESKINVAKKHETMKCIGVGNMSFKNCNLKDVMVVPELETNLLSVGAITDNDGIVIFTKKQVVVKHNNKIILKGNKLENGLYTIQLEHNDYESSFLSNKRKDAILWHERLAHLSESNMKKLVQITDGIDLTYKDIDNMGGICDICLKSKHVRTTFDNERTKTNNPLDMIHTDVCGLINPETWDGKRYFVSMLDDHTNYLMIYLIRTKSEVVDVIKEYTQLVETQKNSRK